MRLTRKDHVDIVLDAEPEVLLVLLRESRQVNVRVRQVDAFPRRDEAIVARLDLDGLLVDDLEHIERQHAVVDVNDASRLDHFGDVLVVDIPFQKSAGRGLNKEQENEGPHPHVLSIARICILLVGGEVHHLAGRDWDVDITFRVAGADLGALGIEGDGDRATLLDLLGGAHILNDGLCRKRRSAACFVVDGAKRRQHAIGGSRLWGRVYRAESEHPPTRRYSREGVGTPGNVR